jgi:AcrR family transcriptional regulator
MFARRSTRNRAPGGRVQVALASLTAGNLFAKRGPTGISIRDIAARSKLNRRLAFRDVGPA